MIYDPTIRVIALYILGIAAGALAAGLGVMATQLAGTDPINWRPVIAAAIGPIVAGLVGMRLPRPEGAHLADQVDNLKARGVARRDMVVLSEDEALRALGHPEDVGREC